MINLKLGIIGETGQLAQALKQECKQTGIKLVTLNRHQLDLSADSENIYKALRQFDSVDAIINAAAYTAVDQAEDDTAIAFRVNGIAPGIIAEYSATNSIPFVHVSTEYVFNGSSQKPYEETHKTGPLGIYGSSKLAGEKAIASSSSNYSILRTSWVYDGVSKNFLTTMLKLAEDRDVVTVVNDQYGRPTYAPHLAVACLQAVNGLLVSPEESKGTFHVSDTGEVISWAEFAVKIFRCSELYFKRTIKVKGISSSEYPSIAHRPSYSALNVSKFERVFNCKLPHWSLGLKKATLLWTGRHS